MKSGVDVVARVGGGVSSASSVGFSVTERRIWGAPARPRQAREAGNPDYGAQDLERGHREVAGVDSGLGEFNDYIFFPSAPSAAAPLPTNRARQFPDRAPAQRPSPSTRCASGVLHVGSKARAPRPAR